MTAAEKKAKLDATVKLLAELNGELKSLNAKLSVAQEELDRLAEGHFWQQLAGESQGMESYKEADLRKL